MFLKFPNARINVNHIAQMFDVEATRHERAHVIIELVNGAMHRVEDYSLDAIDAAIVKAINGHEMNIGYQRQEGCQHSFRVQKAKAEAIANEHGA